MVKSNGALRSDPRRDVVAFVAFRPRRNENADVPFSGHARNRCSRHQLLARFDVRAYFASRTAWMRSLPISGSYLAMISFTASWNGFLSWITLTLTPLALIFSRFSARAFWM